MVTASVVREERCAGRIDGLQVVFDDDRAVAGAGLILPATLAGRLGLEGLVDEGVDLGARPGAARPGRKVMTLVHGILAGADCIDDCERLRSGEAQAVLGHRVMAPSTLGTFLRAFSFGHVRQLDRASEIALARAWAAGAGPGAGGLVIDLDSTICEVHGYLEQARGWVAFSLCRAAADGSLGPKHASPRPSPTPKGAGMPVKRLRRPKLGAILTASAIGLVIAVGASPALAAPDLCVATNGDLRVAKGTATCQSVAIAEGDLSSAQATFGTTRWPRTLSKTLGFRDRLQTAGFSRPFSGPRRYEYLAPTEVTDESQLNQPIGQRRADRIARRIGLRKSRTLTEQQYLEFISGRGVGGNPDDARLVDESVRILTNTTGRPLYSDVNGVLTPSVLASYGLFVNEQGLLESPANADAPTRQVNAVLAPGGYMGKWMRANGATSTLVQLYRSAYPAFAFYGFLSQQVSGVAQLVTNTKGGVSTEVGMSLAPTIWLVNFTLIYTLNPELAAYMPAHWAPIPPTVADAILASPTGQVPYSEFASAFE